jgi:zinc transporter 1
VAGSGLVINILALFVLDHGHSHGHGHSHAHKHKKDNAGEEDSLLVGNHHPEHHDGSAEESDMNLRGVFLHVLGDAMGSLGALTSGLVIWLTDWEYRHYLDPITSCLIATIICVQTVPLIEQSAHVMMMAAPPQTPVEKLSKQLLKIRGVAAIHDLHVWQLSEKRKVGTVHVTAATDYHLEGSRISREVTALFHKVGIHDVTIQTECAEDLKGRSASMDSQQQASPSHDQCDVACEDGSKKKKLTKDKKSADVDV